MAKEITVLDLLNLKQHPHSDLRLICLAGRKGLSKKVTSPEINRPGLALSGFFEGFDARSIQIFGTAENAYLNKQTKPEREKTLDEIFSRKIPCCIFCFDENPGEAVLKSADALGVPILQTPLSTSDFSMRILRALGNMFAPQLIIHANLIEVLGTGVLIRGESGIGKSETALELIERGHRLIADDSVLIKCLNGNTLLGLPTAGTLSHHMEIRGPGIIDVSRIFGMVAIREDSQIDVLIDLIEWDSKNHSIKRGETSGTESILGVEVPRIEIAVKSGRNIPIIIETTVLNERLKQSGKIREGEFNENILRWIEAENMKNGFREHKKGVM